MNCVLSDNPFLFIIVVASSVKIALKERKIAAGNLHTYLMSRFKVIACSIQVNFKPVYFSLLHPDLFRESFPVPGTQDTALDIVSFAIGMYIHKFYCKIRILCR